MRPSFGPRRPRNNRANVRKGPAHHRSHTLDSNGPDVKVRGSPSQIIEKYLALARDATATGDRVAAEGYLQHAEHYYRVVNANGSGQRSQPPLRPPPGADAKPTDDAAPDPAKEAQP